jgi:hypothetical protein
MLSLELGLSLRHESWEVNVRGAGNVQCPELDQGNGCVVGGFERMRQLLTIE